MLPIICKGKGLVPRVGMIAPILTPFKVTLQMLTVIIKTPGAKLKPYFVDPVTLEETALDSTNYKAIYKAYEISLDPNDVTEITETDDIAEVPTPEEVAEVVEQSDDQEEIVNETKEVETELESKLELPVEENKEIVVPVITNENNDEDEMEEVDENRRIQFLDEKVTPVKLDSDTKPETSNPKNLYNKNSKNRNKK